MNAHLSPAVVVGVVVVVVVLLNVWRASVRRAHRIATVARNSARLGTLTGRVLLGACALGGVQWVALTHPVSPVLGVVVVGMPDVLAAFVIVRAVTVTTVVQPRPAARERHHGSRERGERR